MSALGMTLLVIGIVVLAWFVSAFVVGLCLGIADGRRILRGEMPKHGDLLRGKRIGPRLDRENKAETIRIEEKKERERIPYEPGAYVPAGYVLVMGEDGKSYWEKP